MSTTIETRRSAATTTLWAGLGASLVSAAAVLVDQATVGSIHARLAEVYAGYDVPWQDSESFLVTWLLAVGLLGTVGWLATLRGATRGRRWTAPTATVLFLLGLGAAGFDMVAAEYGRTLFPTWITALGLLPVVVGAVATVLLWRERR
ncbi:hypothetical protein [Pseudonocardia endophytica]|uniref:Uncharacterized protein n=1 Tax=Pseudonocardia endophytica TaxID=401976 RepID=A0A4R1HWN4_PSEEN|nr:hypothetical protein [Pseudonocardia endophytica]TCK27147.1 hypothetical protein EV378_3006 [Pseudonocardia endophytica]